MTLVVGDEGSLDAAVLVIVGEDRDEGLGRAHLRTPVITAAQLVDAVERRELEVVNPRAGLVERDDRGNVGWRGLVGRERRSRADPGEREPSDDDE